MSNGEEGQRGVITQGIHSLGVRIYYEDTDFTGAVYHANHVKYFERGRSDFLRVLGVSHTALGALEQPLAFAVTSLTIRYLKPARIDDWILVKTRFESASGVRFKLSQWIERDGIRLCEGEVEVVCIDNEGRPKRIPKSMIEAMCGL